MFAARYFTSRYFSPRYFTGRNNAVPTVINKWIGLAQSLAERRVMIPENIFPGSVWQLRVGTLTYTYTYPDTIEVASLADSIKAKTVVDGIIDIYDGGGQLLGGGAAGNSTTLTSTTYDGRWALEAVGLADGTPIDVELTASDPTRARVVVVQLQAGRSAANEVIRVRWPAKPGSGNLKLRYEDVEATVAYNASASAVQTALEGLSSIGSGNVSVVGDYQTYYDITFQGTLAAKPAGELSAWSENATGVAAVATELVTSAQMDRATYLLGPMNGNANYLYRFSMNGEFGHYFTGAATADLILAAVGSVPGIGVGNVDVIPLEDGIYRIALIGEFVGTEAGTLGVESAEGSPSVIIAGETTPEYGERKTKIKYTIHNMPHSGTIVFEVDGVATSSPIAWPPTGIATLGLTGYVGVSVSDGLYQAMEIEIEAILPSRDINLVIPQLNVGSLVGCHAIDVRTVVEARASRNEVQQVSIATDPVGGTFTLSFQGQTTSALAYNASASTVQTALLALSTIGSGNCQVSGVAGGPWLVEMRGSLAATDLPLMNGNATLLTLSATAAVVTLQVAIPTGPNWWTNEDNWSLGHVPNVNEIATFEGNATACRYGIDDAEPFGAIDIYRSYTGAIGLPAMRADGTPETLPQSLKLSNNGGSFRMRIGLGDDGAGPSLVRINSNDQAVIASVFYTQTSLNDGTYAVMLEGPLDELHVGDAAIGVGIVAGTTGSIGKLRMRQRGNQGGSIVEWGELVTADDVHVQIGSVRAGSPPKALFMVGGDAIVRGIGNMESMILRDAIVRWLAGGEFGKQGLIESLDVDGDGQAVITSAAHGLVDGTRVFISNMRGVRDLSDGYYGIADVTTDTFTLVGTLPRIPFGAVSPSTVGAYYESSSARWGLADAVVLGAAATVDMSEQAAIRTLGAPVVIQSADAVFNDPLVTVPDLRLRYDPGTMEETMGTRCVIRRDERAAASASAGYAGGAGGFVISELG